MGASSGRAVTLVVGLIFGAGGVGLPLYQKLNATATQLSATQQKLVDTSQQLAATKQQLTAATLQVLQLQQKSSELASQQVQLAKHDLPVLVSTQIIPFGAGRRLVIRNLTTADLPIVAEFGRAGFPSASEQLVIPAHGVLRVGGPGQNWTFLAGDKVNLSNPQYRPKDGVLRF